MFRSAYSRSYFRPFVAGGSVFAVALLLSGLSACSPHPLNLVVISLDTLRADHLGFYGYDRPTSPTLDALAKRSVVFERAISHMPTTGPSHFSLLTGVYPHTHGVFRNGQKLPEGLATLGSILGERAYATGGFVSGLPLTDSLSGLAAEFQTFDGDFPNRRRDGAKTVDRAISWLQEWKEQPYFLFVHLFDAHGPYEPPAELVDMMKSEIRGPWAPWIPRYQRQIDPSTGGVITDTRHYVDRYDASIRYLDMQLERLFSEIDLDNTVVLVVSDHGESLDDRLEAPFDHGSRLFEEQIRIVGLLRAPDLEARRVEGLVGMVDFSPTLLSLLGHEDAIPETSEGRNWWPGLRAGKDVGKRAEFSSCTVANYISEPSGFRVDESKLGTSVRVGDMKLTAYPAPNDEEILFLHDLSRDPGETSKQRFQPGNPEVKPYLDLLNRWNRRRHEAFQGDDQVPDEFRRKLESLGYIF